MSKFLFWSPYHGLGQTCNLHVTSSVFSCMYEYKVLLMQTHFKKNNLEFPLVGYNVEKGKANNDLFHSIGLDMAVTFSNMKLLNEHTLMGCCLTPTDSLWLLPGTEVENRETYDRDIGDSVHHLINDAAGIVDHVIIDANSGNDPLSFKLMGYADLIVVNLTQRRYAIDSFFKEYGEIFLGKENVFYLFGDYDDNSVYNINNFRSKYGKYISHNNSGVIPYCTKLLDALNESNLLKFMQEGLIERNGPVTIKSKIKKIVASIFRKRYYENETDYFFHKGELAANKMLQMLKKSKALKGKRGE